MTDYLETLTKALRQGAKMHAFLSGGGLRVVRLEKRDKLVGYGEHPSIDDALSHAAEDYLAGGRPYAEVYGGLYPHYLTGSCETTSALDAWVRRGRTFDAHAAKDEIVVVLKGMGESRMPQEAWPEIKAGRSFRWKERGYTLEARPCRFANGDLGASTVCVELAPGRDKYRSFYDIEQTGRAATLEEAFHAALEAEAIEVTEKRTA